MSSANSVRNRIGSAKGAASRSRRKRKAAAVRARSADRVANNNVSGKGVSRRKRRAVALMSSASSGD